MIFDINRVEIPPFKYYYHEESIESLSLDIDEELSSLNEAIDKDTGHGNILKPVFIVLLHSNSRFDRVAEKFVKGQSYWHSSIGFGPSLKRLYSFNYDEADANKHKGGLSFESLQFYRKEHPEGTMEVSCILLNDLKYKQLKATLDYYIRNKEKTRYDFANLIRALFGKKTKDGLKFNLVCSTFVDTILKSADIKLNNVHTNLVKPDDLKVNEYKEKQFKVFAGKIMRYNVKKATDMVDKLTQDEINKYTNSILPKEKSDNKK